MRLSFHDQSPNTVAAVAGAAFVVAAMAYPRMDTRMRAGFLLVCVCCAWVLCLTQSRGAGLALGALAAVLGLRSVGRPAFRPAAVLSLGAALAIWTWAGLHGRAAPASLGNSAGMRADFATAALMRAAESRFHGVMPVSAFAEDAALRYGTPVSAAQRDILRNPLSSLLNLAADPRPWAILTWISWLAPAWCLVWTAIPASRSFRTRSFDAEESPAAWAIPAACLFTAICAVFNDLDQNTAGVWAMRSSAACGLAWLAWCFVRAGFRLPALGLGTAAVSLLVVLAAGELFLRENFARHGIRRWQIEERVLPGGGALRVVEGGASLVGTLFFFDHRGRGELSWEAGQGVRRLVGAGWRLVEIPGGIWPAIDVRELCAAGLPVVAIGVQGPVPANFVRAARPAGIVSVAPSRLVQVSDDGGEATAMRYWLVEDEEAMSEARRLLALALARTEADTEILPLAPDLSASMRGTFRRIADRHAASGVANLSQ